MHAAPHVMLSAPAPLMLETLVALVGVLTAVCACHCMCQALAHHQAAGGGVGRAGGELCGLRIVALGAGGGGEGCGGGEDRDR